MTEPLGTVVIDERIMSISEIRLEGGRIIVRCLLPGPAEELPFDVHVYRVHGTDGQLVWIGQGMIDWPEIPDGREGWFDIQLAIGANSEGDKRANSMPSDGSLP